MGGLRQCENEETPHFTDDLVEMFCMECGRGFLPGVHANEAVPGNFAPRGSEGGVPNAVSPTILQGRCAEAVVRFPWGDERFSERLAVGRDPAFSTIAGQLGSFPTVSGAHAEFWLRADGLVLIHISRSNPWIS